MSVLKGMEDTLVATDLNAAPQFLRAVGLSALYAWAFVVWSRDETRDMAKTMATLDKALRFGGTVASFLGRR